MRAEGTHGWRRAWTRPGFERSSVWSLSLTLAWILAPWLMCPASASAAPSVTETPPDAKWEEVTSLEHKLREIESRVRSEDSAPSAGGSVTLTQAEINSYLQLSPTVRLPEGVRDLRFQLSSGRIQLRAKVDLDRIRESLAPTTSFPGGAFLGGQVALEISGALESAEGFGSFTLDDVWLGPAPISASVVEQAIRTATRSERNPAGIQILSPFRLPYSIRRIRLKSGRVVLDF